MIRQMEIIINITGPDDEQAVYQACRAMSFAVSIYSSEYNETFHSAFKSIPDDWPDVKSIHELHSRADDLRRLKFTVVEERMIWR